MGIGSEKSIVDTRRSLPLVSEEDGRSKIFFDVLRQDGTAFEEVSFFISTALAVTSFTRDTLEALGYAPGDSTEIQSIRIGCFDFNHITVVCSEANILAADILKSLDLELNFSSGNCNIDLLNRLKHFVDKGINRVISPALKSRIKSSRYKNENWFTWAEIDNRYPDSWVILWGGDDDLDLGGEVLWHSQTEVPEAIQDNTFIYCNKSFSSSVSPFAIYVDSIRGRKFAEADEDYEKEIKKLEAALITPTINRFYYDPVSTQGKLYRKKGLPSGRTGSNAILSQVEIDVLVAQHVKK